MENQKISWKIFPQPWLLQTKGKLPEPEIDHSFVEDQNHSECIAGPSLPLQGTSLPTIKDKPILVPTDTSTPQPLKSPCYCSELGPMPPQIAGKTWVPAWTLRENKSFSELVLDKMKGPKEKPPLNRRNIDKTTKVMTDEVYPQEIPQIQEKVTRKKSMSKKLEKKSIKKKIEYKMSDSTTNNSNDESENKDENEIEESSNDKQSDPESENSCLEDKLVSLCGGLSPSKEENLIQKRYGCIYENFSKPSNTKKQTLYTGKILRRFLSDENGKAYAVEVESLTLKVRSGTILESVPEHLGCDISIFPLYNIIAGPFEVLPMKNNKWNVINYEKVKERFKECEKIDRKDIFNRI